MRYLTKDRVGGLLILIFCIAYAILSQQIRLLPFQADQAFTARTMPEVLSVLGIGLALFCIFLPGKNDEISFPGYDWLTVALFLALMSIYGISIRPLGFILSTSLFLMIGFWLLGERSPIRLILVAVPLVLLFWVLMTQGLDVFIEPLPAFMKG
jgi:putative tricarboxylic transport membrane protein